MSNKEATLAVYACGGAAINIVAPLLQGVKTDEDQGYAKINYALIDTSRSNVMGIRGAEEYFYMVDGRSSSPTDGSGKVRSTNLPAVRQSVPEILAQFMPGDLSVVISSASGGSGSVIAPVLVSELLSRGKNVVVIAIGSTTCSKQVSNTIDTIESYQTIAEKRERPVVCFYMENGKTTIAHNDQMARSMILMLATVWSGKNNGLDSQDLLNFLNYQNVTKYPIGIVGLDIKAGSEKLAIVRGQPVSTVITLVSSKEEDHAPGIPVGYHSYGEFSSASVKRLGIDTPIHLCTVQGWFRNELEALRVIQKEGEEHYRVHPVDAIKTSREADDDGLIV